MCGIAGAWEFKDKVNIDALARMRDRMSHRGPDDSGMFADPGGQVALAHQRLSIIDLSAAGHQPMQRGDLTVTYNGEIYNFQEVKRELSALGVVFSSNSDTEVLLRAYEQWGNDSVLKFRGMFAFGLWDAARQKLTLCRDRAGVKPLYYYFDADRFLFASELQALAGHPSVRKEVNLEAIGLFLWLGYIPSPHSAWKNVYKLEPGHFLEIERGAVPVKKKYWDISEGASAALGRQAPDEAEALRETEKVLTESFKLRMVADVPVGVFLSGGIDSSLLAALLMKDAKRPLTTFTVGFGEEKYNEAEHAKRVAAYLRTEHHEIYLSQKKGSEIIARLPGMFGEPFGGASAIPTFLVSEFARSKVTVALSADGGDELFGGYGRKYISAAATYEKYAKVPGFAASIARGLSHIYGASTRAELLAARGNLAATYGILNKRLFSFAEVGKLLKNRVAGGFASSYFAPFNELSHLEPAVQLQLFDFKTSFADNILAKVDRASMAVSLESREPFLDPVAMKLAASLPTKLKWKGGESKYLLKKILYKYVPQELVDRPKHGFSMPIRTLLSASDAPYISQYLDENKIKKSGILDWDMVRIEKVRFLDGSAAPHRLWRILMLQMWAERWGL